MTFGPLPLRHYLHPEAHKYQLTLQRYHYHYLDLNKEFSKSFPLVEAPASLDVIEESIPLSFDVDVVLCLMFVSASAYMHVHYTCTCTLYMYMHIVVLSGAYKGKEHISYSGSIKK